MFGVNDNLGEGGREKGERADGWCGGGCGVVECVVYNMSPDSSNHSLSLVKLFSFSCPDGNVLSGIPTTADRERHTNRKTKSHSDAQDKQTDGYGHGHGQKNKVDKET